MQSSKSIILVCCGSFNPIHELHLLIFEIAKNYFTLNGRNCYKGIISPANDRYWKNGLLHSSHRVAMCREAVKTSDWITVDDWESKQTDYVRTYNVLSHEREVYGNDYDIYFIGSDDLLPNMADPKCWDPVLLEKLVSEFGVVMLRRLLENPEKEVEKNAILVRHKEHIFVCSGFQAQHSSTEVRNLVKQGLSIKYMVPDLVIDYIKANKLYLE
ncbi:nicotinamide-nucleotide adenylyltransferase, putative [Entamoeba invadens IP1]|uniref:nicotinamide-nucleotide adenylyltransferase, putative n=1 Tax=Entamoeba invadens IP1 TaxID=370355 RepID=UPI0002C3D112|nr:nicotinamide-nucleotide adenylyltransferase, putative [Entamoeba invadens IP1]ELP94133.1 nicotinamide-nucleotide adenylyltransferase, putative [Entamoeba invadens IP1]|eukprot:XP_004260904.1 nicotinamide-nucleotide adenylyltransferase, putative [Entamoeba invadens IP1]